MSKRIVITDHPFANLDEVRRIAHDVGAEVEVHGTVDKGEVMEATRGADVVIIDYAPIDHDVLAGLADGAVVVRAGIGVDNIDLDAAREAGVRICNVPDYGATTVADHTLMLVLAVHRKALMQHRTVVESGWAEPTDFGSIVDLADATYGIVGAGQIARHVARRAAAFGATVISSDPFIAPEVAANLDFEMVEFDELIRRSDIISLHAPATPATRHMIGREQFAAMKPGVTLVNTARGPLIDTVALAEALLEGAVGGAGIDVFETEPLEADHPLRTAPRALLTPHTAYYSERSVHRVQLYSAEEAGRALRGEPLRCEIT